jgi:hypothetical protein
VRRSSHYANWKKGVGLAMSVFRPIQYRFVRMTAIGESMSNTSCLAKTLAVDSAATAVHSTDSSNSEADFPFEASSR